ncbi:esterase B1-like [Onthophagus taurus]|uniref:esterase B1-like n=1 Tax=Onthophagus taurus TaxID=166361 RepID=UPI0039BDA9BE
MNTIVRTQHGLVKGTTSLDYDEELFYCFYGIPYGKPPIGELRFKAPVDIENWTGVKDCTEVKDGCFSRHIFTMKFTGSEDCLHLNVYTKELNAEAKKPVFVWIHGGAFVTGSGNPDVFGPEFLITQNIVIVTLTYRLGPLGFLCLEDTSLEVPGNAGVKDVLMGLKWVHKNIRNFGGDDSNITIAGQSAGAIMVNFMMLSPLAKGLFHKAIMQSACALQNWALGKREGAKELAERLGLKSESEKEILEFLRGVEVEKLLRASQKIRILRNDMYGDNIMCYNPVIEKPNPGAVITEPPLLKILRGDYNKVPLLMGYTSNEGLYADFLIKGMTVLIDDFEKMVPHTLQLPKGSEASKMIAAKIQQFFFKDSPATIEHKDKYMKMGSGLFFSYPVYRIARHMVDNLNHPIYFYRFSIDAKLNLYKLARKFKANGASHTDDTCYLFKTMFTPEISPGSVEDVAVRKITKLWGNFIKFGKPVLSKTDPVTQIDWKPIQKDEFNFVDIQNDRLVPGKNPDETSMIFWDDIYKLDPLYAKHKL